jgi:hypothetical protein
MNSRLITGKLMRNPELKTSQNGVPYTHFMLAMSVGEEKPIVVSGIGYGLVAKNIAKLRTGDPLSVVGSLKPSAWIDKITQEKRHGLSLIVKDSLTHQTLKPNYEHLRSQYPASNDADFIEEVVYRGDDYDQ